MFTHAITRLPGENFADGLTTAHLGKPDYSLILQQHHSYRQALLSLGLDLLVLPAEPGFPDAYFVEDPAIVTSKIAIITRSGAPSRQGEENSLVPFLEYYRPIRRILASGSVDGGDVLMVGNHFFIGLSERTNTDGAAQLAGHLIGAGHTAETVSVTAGLHLKSSVNYVGKNTLLVTRDLSNYPGFRSFDRIILDEDEEYAANTLWVNDSLLMPKGFPKTHTQLAGLGMPIIELDVSEIRKMDGGLTCMSLRF
ncbi:MAG TPA: arginine deiminase family protein [Anaerolineales bacterium]|nr:arginine deiminase family protein [Anaerolineales bacterium]